MSGAIALTAASTIVLTRFLGVDDYGRFTVLTVFLLIGASLSEFGLNGTAIRWFASGERPEDVFASLIGLRLVLSSAAAVVALVIFALYPHSETPLSAVILTTIAMVLAGVEPDDPDRAPGPARLPARGRARSHGARRSRSRCSWPQR